MNNLLNVKGIRVKEFRNECDERMNNFLTKHDGNIINIQFMSNKWGTQILIVYKEDSK